MGRKWNNIKMKKAAMDKQRSQNYSKVLREIAVAVQRGGAEQESNFALKVALAKAKKFNVPRDNIDKAIKRGLGGTGDDWQEVNYEGYGLDGVAIFVEAMTNNPTRTIANIRTAFKAGEGSLGKEGCLQFVFERKAIFTLKAPGVDLDELTLALIDVGAEEVEEEAGMISVKAPVESFGDVHRKLEDLKLEIEESGLERIPLLYKEVKDKEKYASVLKIIQKLEDDEDVQNVYHNMEDNEAFEV